MEKDKSILLQKQIRDNSEDLQREFLDMQAWEKEMKRKDKEIRSMSVDDKVLPPIRKKKKKSPSSVDDPKDKNQSNTASSNNSSGVISEHEVCKNVDKIQSPPEKVQMVETEIPSEEDLENQYVEANKLKEEGNALVKNQEYAKAISKYTAAIKIFPGSAVFFSNRAFCQLKLDNLYSAESDCTEALRLDSKYAKAYHRRATIRYELKRYKDAKKDLESTLELEPNNNVAKCLLAQVQKQIKESTEPVIQNKPTPLEKKIGEKMFAKLTTSKKDSKSEEKKIVEVEKVPEAEGTVIKTENIENSLVKQTIELEEDKKPKIIEIEPETEYGSPSWLPKLKEGVCIIETLTEAPKKSKDKLRRVPVKEISNTESIFKDIEETRIENIGAATSEKETAPKTETIKKVQTKEIKKQDSTKVDPSPIDNVPPPPKSSVAFLLNWRKNSSLDFRHKYLKQITPSDLPDIFKESMESNILSEILQTLSTKFIADSNEVYEFLNYLAKLKRFRALLLFMTEADKNALIKLFQYCKETENKSEGEVKELRSAYEM